MFNVYVKKGGKPVKVWNKHTMLEDEAKKQLENLSLLPYIHKHVAAMPDVHAGIGSTVGSVIATKNAIIPAAVGVDIGCGMCAVKTNITAEQLPDDLKKLRNDIERNIPRGSGRDSGNFQNWKEQDLPQIAKDNWNKASSNGQRLKEIIDKHPRALHSGDASRYVSQMGTLGSGNHFVELCKDQQDSIWVMLHSGSRGMGNQIGKYFISKAREQAERMHYAYYLPDRNLAHLSKGDDLFEDYLHAMHFAQDYARENRNTMLYHVMQTMKHNFKDFKATQEAINCHHNYATLENHFGENVYITRKGAVAAQKDQLGIIPGSMGTSSYIVKGKGNPDSFSSCSHGAGRSMSRTQAFKTFSKEDHKRAMRGIECRLDEAVLDETPKAYKDIEDVMQSQEDLVDIVARLSPVLNIKG